MVKKAAVLARENQSTILNVISLYTMSASAIAYVIFSSHLLANFSFALQIVNVSLIIGTVIIIKSRKLNQGLFLNLAFLIVSTVAFLAYF